MRAFSTANLSEGGRQTLKRQAAGSRAVYAGTIHGPPASPAAPGAGGGGVGMAVGKTGTYVVRIDDQLNDIFGVSM